MFFFPAEVSVEQTPLKLPSVETALGPDHKESTTVNNESGLVETNQEGLLFQKRVLKVCSHLKQENIVTAAVLLL